VLAAGTENHIAPQRTSKLLGGGCRLAIGDRSPIGIRIQAKHCPVEGGQPMRYSNWLAGSEQWLHQRLDRGNGARS